MSGSHVWRFKNNLHGFLALPLTSTDSLGKSQLFDFVRMIFYYYIIDTECHALYPGLESLLEWSVRALPLLRLNLSGISGHGRSVARVFYSSPYTIPVFGDNPLFPFFILTIDGLCNSSGFQAQLDCQRSNPRRVTALSSARFVHPEYIAVLMIPRSMIFWDERLTNYVNQSNHWQESRDLRHGDRQDRLLYLFQVQSKYHNFCI